MSAIREYDIRDYDGEATHKDYLIGDISHKARSSRRPPPQAFGDVEAVIRRRGFADFADVDAVVTDKNGPQRGLLFLVTDRASGCRLAPRWGLGGGLRFLDLAFEADKSITWGLEFGNAFASGGQLFLPARRRAPAVVRSYRGRFRPCTLAWPPVARTRG